MRTLSSALIASLLVLGWAGPSLAAPEPFHTATLSLQIGTNAVVVTGVSGTADVTRTGGGDITGLALDGGIFQTTGYVIVITDPMAQPIAGIQITGSNSSGTFSDGGGHLGGFGGKMPLAGVSKVCLFAPCSSAAANVSVPLTVAGNAGSATVGFFVEVTVGGAPWTDAKVTGATLPTTAMNFAAWQTAMGAPVSTTGSITQMGISAHVRLVSPTFVSTNIPASAVVPVWGILEFDIPEPTTIALGLAAVGSLLVMGRRRRRAG
jgi:hypothetical protein